MRAHPAGKTAAGVSVLLLIVVATLAGVDRESRALQLFGFDSADIGLGSAGSAGEWSGPEFPRIRSKRDANKNGVSDTDDIILGAREEARRMPVYKSAYYRGGYPPETEGVCTDVIWRAFKHAGYDLKSMVDADIRGRRPAYLQAVKPDPHIDFRGVPNLRSFFSRHGLTLPTHIVPGDPENLAGWQPGDIVTFTNPDHIAILSDKRNSNGVPLLLHNDGPVASESDSFMFWYSRGITGHYRFPRIENSD